MREHREYRGNRDSRGGGGHRSFHGGGRPRHSGPREMHDAVCSDCGASCTVPFKPAQDRPVYCSTCFQNHKTDRPSRGNFERRERVETEKSTEEPSDSEGSSTKETEETGEIEEDKSSDDEFEEDSSKEE